MSSREPFDQPRRRAHPEPAPDEDGAYTGETRVMPRIRPPDAEPPPPQARRLVRRRKRSIAHTIRLALLGLAGLVLLVLVLVYLQVRNLAGHISVADVRPAPVIATPLAGANILLIGVDQRPDFPEEGVRSDTLIVLHLDTPGRWVSMLSIPRDSVVEVGDLGQTKINTAYSYGFANAQNLYGEGTSATQAGMALAAQTVEQFTGVPIHYVAQVNFDGFAAIVDALGGVTIDVPRRIVDDEYPTPDFGTMHVEFEPGPQHMDGQRALIYARTRHADSDFGRGERQQQVINAILDEVRQRGPVGQALLLGRLGDALDGAVATTLPIDRLDTIAGLGWLASGVKPDNIIRLQLTPETAPNVREEGSDLYWDADEVRALARQLLTPPDAKTEQARIQVLNGTDTPGLAGRTSLDLEQRGFTMIPAGDAPSADMERTTVYDVTGKPATAQAVARVFGAQVQRGTPEGVLTDADIVVILGADQRP